jgi:hypothetical protein
MKYNLIAVYLKGDNTPLVIESTDNLDYWKGRKEKNNKLYWVFLS